MLGVAIYVPCTNNMSYDENVITALIELGKKLSIPSAMFEKVT